LAPLKLRSLYPVGKILLFRVSRDAEGPLWRRRLENSPVERLPSTLAPLTLTVSKSGGLNFVKSCPELNIQRPLASTLETHVRSFYGVSFSDYSSVVRCTKNRAAVRRTTAVWRQTRRNLQFCTVQLVPPQNVAPPCEQILIRVYDLFMVLLSTTIVVQRIVDRAVLRCAQQPQRGVEVAAYRRYSQSNLAQNSQNFSKSDACLHGRNGRLSRVKCQIASR